MKVIILAAGSQSRWQQGGGRGFKQLATVGGEALIHRTFRLASARCPDVVTVVRDQADPMWAGLNPKAAKFESWMGEQGKILQCVHLWPAAGEMITLLGDVYYSEDAIAAIFEHDPPAGPTVFGHSGSGVRGEIFAFRFDVNRDRKVVLNTARKATEIEHSRGGLWRWFYVHATGETSYGRHRLNQLARRSDAWVELPHDETDDFDHPSYLTTWARKFGRQFGKEIMPGRIATKRIYGIDRHGREVLVAAPGQVVPAGYRQTAPPVDFQAPAPEPDRTPADELSRLTVVQLRELADRRQVDVSGLRKAAAVGS